MAKEKNDNISVFTDVIASLVLSALESVPGVTLAGDSRDKSKCVTVLFKNGDKVDIDICVDVRLGESVPVEVCTAQEKIKAFVEKSTKYTVASVNVHVVGVICPPQES